MKKLKEKKPINTLSLKKVVKKSKSMYLKKSLDIFNENVDDLVDRIKSKEKNYYETKFNKRKR